MTRHFCLRQSITALALAVLVGALMATSSLAQDVVTQQITSSGTLSAFVDNAALSPVTYSNKEGSSSGSLALTVDDPRGTSAGWNVTISSGDFVYNGTNPAALDIPVDGFTFTAANTPTVIEGQPINAGGPTAQTVTDLTLEVPREVISANAGSGSGTYGQVLQVALVIPAQSLVGTYVATLTVTVASGP